MEVLDVVEAFEKGADSVGLGANEIAGSAGLINEGARPRQGFGRKGKGVLNVVEALVINQDAGGAESRL